MYSKFHITMEPTNTPASSLYQDILQQFLQDKQLLDKNPIIFNENSNKLAVIIDPRFDDTMEAVIRNFMYFMNPQGWNLKIISWSGYEEIICSKFPNTLFQSIDDSDIFMDRNNIPNIQINTYNQMLTDKIFWETMPAKHIAIFQKDCIMFRMFSDYFYNFYEFSGANYYNKSDVSLFYGGINGGFSLRNRDTMIRCIEKVSWTNIQDYRQRNMTFFGESTEHAIVANPHEDVFFTHACEILRCQVPDKLHRTMLAIEADINHNTCVFHGWQHPYHDLENATIFLNGSPLFRKYINKIAD